MTHNNRQKRKANRSAPLHYTFLSSETCFFLLFVLPSSSTGSPIAGLAKAQLSQGVQDPFTQHQGNIETSRDSFHR